MSPKERIRILNQVRFTLLHYIMNKEHIKYTISAIKKPRNKGIISQTLSLRKVRTCLEVHWRILFYLSSKVFVLYALIYWWLQYVPLRIVLFLGSFIVFYDIYRCRLHKNNPQAPKDRKNNEILHNFS